MSSEQIPNNPSEINPDDEDLVAGLVEDQVAIQEVLADHEGIKASEVFPTSEELWVNSAYAVDEGLVTVEPIYSSEEIDRSSGEYPIHAALEIGDLLTDESKKKLEEANIGSLYIEDPKKLEELVAEHGLEFTDIDAFHQREAEAAREELIKKAAQETTPWYIGDPKIEEEIENGNIRQIFEITDANGDYLFPVINFGEIDISEEDLQDIRDAVNDMDNATGGAASANINAIIFQRRELFLSKDPETQKDREVLGSAMKMNGTIRMNEGLLRAGKSKLGKLEDIPGSDLKKTLIHEETHIVESTWDKNKNYSHKLGWKQIGNSKIVDDFGDIKQVNRERYIGPDIEQLVFEDGEYKTVNLHEEFGASQAQSESPVTEYGAYNGREDAAEAAIPYFYGQEEDLGPIRRNAYSNLLNEASAGHYGPFSREIREVSPEEFKDRFKIKSAQYKLRMAYTFNVKPYERSVNSSGYTRESNNAAVIDDYGNLVEDTGRVQVPDNHSAHK